MTPTPGRRRAVADLLAPGRRRALVALAVGVVTAAVVAAVGLVGTGPAAPLLPPRPALVTAVGSGAPLHPIVVLGASISAGTGSSAEQAWPTIVGRCLGEPVMVGAVPGAGYLSTGRGARGPVGLDPSMVVLQAGHNDVGTPAPQLRAAVTTAVGTAGREAPRARLVLITVFAHVGAPTAESRATDATIVEAARRADPRVVVLDPLTEGWSFPRVADGLHPTAVGQRVVAGHVLAGLARAGVARPGTCPNGPPTPLTPS